MSTNITLDGNSVSVQHLCKNDLRLKRVVSMIGPISYKPYDDPYVFLIHEVIEQMLSKNTGSIIFNKLETICGGHISPNIINELSDTQLRSIGTSSSKVSYIRHITDAVIHNELDFDTLKSLPDNDVFHSLVSIRGIGKWTAKMYLIFVLDRQDILPFEDAAFKQAFKWLYHTADCSEKQIANTCEIWKPYSSIASRYLYRALDMGFTKLYQDLFA